MNRVITVCFIITGIINFIPIIGVLSDQQLQKMYGVAVNDPGLSILLKHRAVLFGLLGGFILYAAFVPKYQMMAFVLGFISMVAFLVIALGVGNYNPAIRKVVVADIIGIVCFVIAAVLTYLQSR